MSRKRLFAASLWAFLLFGISACGPQGSSDDSQADFYVSLAGQSGVNGYLPNGYGWKPNSQVEISIWNEPEGPGRTNNAWKKILDENVDASSMFGFGQGAPFYPVTRSICGNPEEGQTVLFMAKSLTTGRMRMRQVPAHIYYTFRPC
jgi:hypothetical protein